MERKTHRPRWHTEILWRCSRGCRRSLKECTVSHVYAVFRISRVDTNDTVISRKRVGERDAGVFQETLHMLNVPDHRTCGRAWIFDKVDFPHFAGEYSRARRRKPAEVSDRNKEPVAVNVDLLSPLEVRRENVSSMTNRTVATLCQSMMPRVGGRGKGYHGAWRYTSNGQKPFSDRWRAVLGLTCTGIISRQCQKRGMTCNNIIISGEGRWV